MTDISVILTGHREGVLAGPTMRSAKDAIDHAKENKLSIELVVVLDNSDKLTGDIIQAGLPEIDVIVHTQYGDPGQARNHGVNLSSGECIAFLDADDLWSFNWLVEAWSMIKGQSNVIAHSQFNVTFGESSNIWWHIDQNGPFYDEMYLAWANYWDAMSFAGREIYMECPFKKNDLKLGFAHEDWHWNTLTISKGYIHKPVENTVHFKRRRKGSQMAKVAERDSVVWPLRTRSSS